MFPAFWVKGSTVSRHVMPSVLFIFWEDKRNEKQEVQSHILTLIKGIQFQDGLEFKY